MRERERENFWPENRVHTNSSWPRKRPTAAVTVRVQRTLPLIGGVFFFDLYAVCRQFEASASRAWRLRYGAGSARRRAVSREARGRRRAFAVLTLGPTSMATCLLHCRPRDGEAPCTVAQRLLYRDVPAAASHGTACWACQGSGCFGRRAAEDPLSSSGTG